MKIAVARNISICFVAAALLSLAVGCGNEAPAGGLDTDGVAANNRGVAYMGRFDFEAALEVFSVLAERYPDNPDIQVNLGIATMNRQQEGDEETAKGIFDRVLENDPSNVRAAYNSGIIDLHRGQAEAAMPRFQLVAEADPTSAEAFYHLGQSHMQLQQFEQALSWFERAIEIDPYLSSAHYRAFQAAQRLGDRERAEAFIERFQTLESNPRSHLVEFKYTRMGQWAEVVALGSGAEKTTEMPPGPIFDLRVELCGASLHPWPQPDITVCDIDNDGAVDLFIAGAKAGEATVGNAVALAGETGFDIDAGHPLASIDAVNTALWGDIDNDGLTDVYLCRRGPNQLWRQLEGGSWQDITISTGTGGGSFDTIDGALFDADHDGDLDIFVVNSNGENELFNNNRDGSFRPLAAASGLTGEGNESRGLLVADFDGDLDADIIVINEDPPHQVYINELIWDYRTAAGWDAFTAADIEAVVAGDTDADGHVEIFSTDGQGTISRWQEAESGNWTADTVATGSHTIGSARLALADVNGNGDLELVTSTDSGWRVVSPADGTELFTTDGGGAAWALAALDPSRGPSLVAFDPDDGLSIWRPGPGRLPFTAVSLSGREDDASSVRTNASGIGARLAVRAGSRWTVVDTYRADSGPGQSLQPLLLGLGGAPRIDFISIDWSDGVLQTEMDLEPGSTNLVAETQRQLSSCPVLFAWDGRGYAFVTDLLGVGGVGYSVGPGEYSTPRPWENLMLPPSTVPRDGRLLLEIGEPMEETAYLDAARMVAYDLPPGWSMTLDERMGVLGPEPTGRPIIYRRVATPERAINERSEDVTDTIVTADLRAAPVGPLDQRFIGRLAGEHVLTLSFAEPLDALGDELVLIADGWVEYPYSSTMFAAWQAGADYRAPTLSARSIDDSWTDVLVEFGYPAGMPRRMAMPLPKIPRGTRELRLATNQEIYWDRLQVVAADDAAEVVRRQLPLVAARVENPGFARRTTGAQRLPHYDWAHRAPLWDTRFQIGFYTAFGDALELVAAADDAVAVFGPGEAIHLEFETPEEGPPPGWTRIYVLETEGWCKDMDLLTRDRRTVEPLPNRGDDLSARDRLHEKYNTRYVSSAG